MSSNNLDKLIEELLQEAIDVDSVATDRPKTSKKFKILTPTKQGQMGKKVYGNLYPDKGPLDTTALGNAAAGNDSDEALRALIIWVALLEDQKKHQSTIDSINTKTKFKSPEQVKELTFGQVADLVKGVKDGNFYFNPEFYTPETPFFNDKAVNSVINQLKTTEKPKNVFDKNDIITILKNPKHKFHYWLVEFLEKAVVLAQQNKAGGLDANKIKKLFKIVQTIDPEDRALGYDRAIPTIPIQSRYKSKFGLSTPATLARIFENVGLNLRGIGPVKVFGKLQQFADEIINPEPKQNISIELEMSKVLAIDYLRRIVQDYESSAGGYLFENFLALLMAGSKEGGNTKIEDFTFNMGREGSGSAKLYRSEATKYGGSSKLFFNYGLRNIGKPVFYVLARKGQSLEEVTIFRDQIQVLKSKLHPDDDPHFFVFSKKNETAQELYDNGDRAIMSVNDVYLVNAKSKGEIKFQWPMDDQLGKINLISLSIENDKYAEVIKQTMDSTKEKLGTFYQSLNNFNVVTTKFFSIMKDPKNNAQKQDAYDDALDKILDLRTNALTTFTAAAGTYAPKSKGVPKGQRKTNVSKAEKNIKGELQETNLSGSIQQLDKLILEILQESLDK